MGQTITERREIFHALRLNEHLDPLNPAVNSYIDQAQSGFLQQTGDTAAAEQMAWQCLESLREQQASALAYFDAFLIFAVLAVLLAVLVLLMKRSVAEKAAHPHMEWGRQMAYINHFYFYLWDSDWGAAFWKTNAYAPYPIWL